MLTASGESNIVSLRGVWLLGKAATATGCVVDGKRIYDMTGPVSVGLELTHIQMIDFQLFKLDPAGRLPVIKVSL